VIRRAETGSPPAEWVAFIAEQLKVGKGSELDDALSVVGGWTKREGGGRTIDFTGVGEGLGAVARAADRRLGARISALDLSARISGKPLDSGGFELVVNALTPSTDPVVRGQAIAVLKSVPLGQSQRGRLAGALAGVGPMEWAKLLPVFSDGHDTATGMALIDALARSEVAAAVLDRRALEDVFGGFPESVKERVEREITPRLVRQDGGDAAALQAVLDALPEGGDVRRGQRVFQSAKAACASCHKIGYVGGDLGPDLGRVGAVRSRRDLLEAIVFPSASFVRSYEPVTVTKSDGTVLGGIVRSEGDAMLTLAIGIGTHVDVPRSEIASVAPATVSLMPRGTDAVLSPQELADLLAFLESRR
jgi:putative heme-binding domain-containing protein